MRRKAIPLWAVSLCTLIFAYNACPAEVTQRTLIERHLAAAGGKERLSRIETQLSNFEAQEVDQAFEVELSFKTGDRISLKGSIPGGFVIRQGHDGSGHWWRQDPSGVKQFDDRKTLLEFREMALALNVRAVLDLHTHFPDLALVRREKLGESECHVIQAKTPAGLALELWFDAQSGLLRKAGRTLLDDYRAVEGIQLPHSIKNGSGMSLKLKSVAFNTAMDDARFALPSGATPARPAGSGQEEYPSRLNPGTELGVVRHPAAVAFNRTPLVKLPAYRPENGAAFQVDLRSVDLSGLSLQGQLPALLHADFDSRTVWPKTLPAGFKPTEILDTGKNPGLGTRKLHRRGITGKGIGLAVIDQALLVGHAEYKDRLRSYEEIHLAPGCPAQMHGPAVASIAVGKSVGVAPEADLYYIAEQHGTINEAKFDWDFTWLARSIERILELNRELPKERRIRVISVSVGWMPQQKGCVETDAAVKKATAEGVFVISTALERTHKLAFHGLGRDPLKDPELPASFGLGSWWANAFLDGRFHFKPDQRLLVPMDARTTASPTGEQDYVYYAHGGWSWSVPYLAGLYALACQVSPEVTPERFWEVALKTGHVLKLDQEGKTIELGNVVNPEALIAALSKSE